MNQKTTKVEAAWLEYQQQLFSFIRAKVATPEDAEDILNDVFTKLTQAINENVMPDNLSSWLYRVTKNRIVDYYRAKRRCEPLPEEIAIQSKEGHVIKQLSKCLLPMIRALPETYQQPLMLSEIEGKKYKDVALLLNLSVPAVKSRILRGREKLQKNMISCCTLYRNKAGEVVDYDQKQDSFCTNCGD